MYFPKEQSNLITNMVAELNNLLGGTYFFVTRQTGGKETKYSLNLTTTAKNKKDYLCMVTPENFGYNYKQMICYLSGILAGIRVVLKK